MKKTYNTIRVYSSTYDTVKKAASDNRRDIVTQLDIIVENWKELNKVNNQSTIKGILC